MKKNLLDKLKHKFGDSKLVVFFWMTTILFGALILYNDGFSLLLGYSENLFPNKVTEEKLENLHTNQNIERIVSVIGEPSKIDDVSVNSVYKESYIFVGQGYIVKALTDQSGTVKILSITTEDESINPSFFSENVILGKSSLYSVNEDIEARCLYFVGANWSYFFEGGYEGGGSNYQTVYLGNNPLGYSSNPSVEGFDEVYNFLYSGDDGVNYGTCDDSFITFRKNMIINTIIISAPGEILDLSPETFNTYTIHSFDLPGIK